MRPLQSEVLKISQVTHDPVDGTKLEPEQQTVSRVLSTAPSEASSRQTGQIYGSLPTEIVAQTTVAELAQGIKRLCKDCKHYDNPSLQKAIKGAERSPDLVKRDGINQIRAHLLATQNAVIGQVHDDGQGDVDVEAALASLGVCRALTELDQELVAVHPLASCPAEVVTPTSPHGLFQARDRETTKAQAIAYDTLMGKARGPR